MTITGQRARSLLAIAHTDLLNAERLLYCNVQRVLGRTRTDLINFRIGLYIRLVLDHSDDRDFLRAATALDGRWRALQARLAPIGGRGSFSAR